VPPTSILSSEPRDMVAAGASGVGKSTCPDLGRAISRPPGRFNFDGDALIDGRSRLAEFTQSSNRFGFVYHCCPEFTPSEVVIAGAESRHPGRKARQMRRHPRPRRPVTSSDPPTERAGAYGCEQQSLSRSRARWCLAVVLCGPSRPQPRFAATGRRFFHQLFSDIIARVARRCSSVHDNHELASVLMPRQMSMVDVAALSKRPRTTYGGKSPKEHCPAPRRKELPLDRRSSRASLVIHDPTRRIDAKGRQRSDRKTVARTGLSHLTRFRARSCSRLHWRCCSSVTSELGKPSPAPPGHRPPRRGRWFRARARRAVAGPGRIRAG